MWQWYLVLNKPSRTSSRKHNPVTKIHPQLVKIHHPVSQNTSPCKAKGSLFTQFNGIVLGVAAGFARPRVNRGLQMLPCTVPAKSWPDNKTLESQLLSVRLKWRLWLECSRLSGCIYNQQQHTSTRVKHNQHADMSALSNGIVRQMFPTKYASHRAT